ncbi:MAG TPA: hypothetical protein PKA37_07375, partial [Planctomycetota bacterium]|nr:hypothetical protein [Planctomycetota bacterium]
MPRLDTIVLKLGSSVAKDERDLPLLVHEIYRHFREGRSVLAVVSAHGSTTDRLLRRVANSPTPFSDHVLAEYLARGERRAARSLKLALDAAGLPNCLCTQEELRFQASGPPGDADPVFVDSQILREALERTGIVIVPGFYAHDAEGRLVLLGRGGSDLSALFLAQSIGAECRLIKDVHGWFDRDPRDAREKSRPYLRMTFADASKDAAPIVQSKAVRIAESLGQPFVVAALRRDGGTLVGAGSTVLGDPSEPPRRLRILLAGLGTVGTDVFREITRLCGEFSLERILVKRPLIPRRASVPGELLTSDPQEFLDTSADILIDLVNDPLLAEQLVHGAMKRGLHVLTANKPLLAGRLTDLRDRAAQSSVELRFGAAVGGVAPIIEWLQLHGHRGIVSLRGVLNGTTNFVLERMRLGASRAEAIKQARNCGLCESSPDQDLQGRDAYDKLRILAQILTREPVADAFVKMKAIPPRRTPGNLLRQVATAHFRDSLPVLQVELERIPRGDPLFELPGASNAL